MRGLAERLRDRQRRHRPECSLECSFCKKGGHQVEKIIAGPGVYICDECIELCVGIIDEERSQGRT
jgi:hypothetical protein